MINLYMLEMERQSGGKTERGERLRDGEKRVTDVVGPRAIQVIMV